MGIIGATYGDDVLKSLSKHLSDEDILKLANKNIDSAHVAKLFDNVEKKAYIGAWSLGKFKDPSLSFEDHFIRHRKKLNLPDTVAGRQQYRDTAVNMMKCENGEKAFLDTEHGTIVIYDDKTGKFVAGNSDGEIATFMYRKPSQVLNNKERFVPINLDG